MSFVLVVNNAVTEERGALPDSARRQDNQQWVLGLPAATVALQQACGYFAVTDAARPADTATLTTDRTVQKVGSTWTVVWVSRNKTAQEIANATANTNQATIISQAQGALTTNATYIALASPTTAQNTAQIKALSQQVDKLIRLALGLFDATT